MDWKLPTILSLVLLTTVPFAASFSAPATAAPAADEPLVEVDGQLVPASYVTGEPGLTGELDGETFVVPSCPYVDPSTGAYRSSMAVGLNNYGTFGDTSTNTGFQSPAGLAFESLAVGFWGEGWLVEIDGFDRRSFQVHAQQGVIELVDDHYTDSSRYTVYTATVFLPLDERHGDVGPQEGVLVDFEFTIDRYVCDVLLRTTIENQSFKDLHLGYERNVDWDVWLYDQGSFVNCWQNIPRGVRAYLPITGVTTQSCKSPVGVNDPEVACTTTTRGLDTYQFADLNAWDDLWVFGEGSYYDVDFAGHPHDDNAGFHWERDLDPHDRWTTFLRYECSQFPAPLIAVPVGPVHL